MIILCGVITLNIIKIVKLRATAKKLIKNHYLYSKEQKKIISKDGVAYKYGNGKVMEKWDDIYDFYETSLFYIIKLSKLDYIPLPKSAFKSCKEREFILQCAKIKK